MRATGAALCLLLSLGAIAQPPPRSAAQVRAFRADNPCPLTGRRSGACQGWAVDHVRALCAGGRDHPSNMQWISDEDHRWKTFIDIRECRKLRRLAETPAQQPCDPPCGSK